MLRRTPQNNKDTWINIIWKRCMVHRFCQFYFYDVNDWPLSLINNLSRIHSMTYWLTTSEKYSCWSTCNFLYDTYTYKERVSVGSEPKMTKKNSFFNDTNISVHLSRLYRALKLKIVNWREKCVTKKTSAGLRGCTVNMITASPDPLRPQGAHKWG